MFTSPWFYQHCGSGTFTWDQTWSFYGPGARSGPVTTQARPVIKHQWKSINSMLLLFWKSAGFLWHMDMCACQQLGGGPWPGSRFLCFILGPEKVQKILKSGKIMKSGSLNPNIMNTQKTFLTESWTVLCVWSGDPDKVLQSKQKIWETLQPDLQIDSRGVANYKGCRFEVKGKGLCRAPTLTNCTIR